LKQINLAVPTMPPLYPVRTWHDGN